MFIMNIKAKIGEVTHTISVENDSTLISELKLSLESLTQIPSASQKWIYQGRILNEKSTIKECNLQNDSCVIVIKTATAQPIAPPTTQVPNNPSQQAYTSPFQPPVPVSTVLFDQSMHLLLNNPEEIVDEAVTLLIKICNNIITNPNEEKYRKVNNTNAIFTKKIGTIDGGLQCMEGIGFRLIGSEWILQPSESAWEVLLKCKSKLDAFLARLRLYKQQESERKPAATPLTTTSVTAVTAESNSVTASTSSTTAVDAASSTPTTEVVPAEVVPAVDQSNILAVQQLLHALQALPSSATTTVAEPPQTGYREKVILYCTTCILSIQMYTKRVYYIYITCFVYITYIGGRWRSR